MAEYDWPREPARDDRPERLLPLDDTPVSVLPLTPEQRLLIHILCGPDPVGEADRRLTARKIG
jgi:hypothetical protein